MRAAGIPDVTSYVFDHDAPSPWTGPVIRVDSVALRKPCIHETWRCPNCRSWTMDGAFKFGRCNFCLTPRPA